MSRRSSTARTLLGAVAVTASLSLVALALAGCSATPTPKTSATSSHAATQNPSTPTPEPTPTFVPASYTCDSILPPPTLAVFKKKASAGFTLQSDYLQRMQNIGSNLVAFSNYGGILCQWAYPDSSSSVDYAFSPISAADAAKQQAALSANGYAPTNKDHGVVYVNSDATDFPDEYLFVDGYWIQASSDAVLGLIVDNVFALPTH
jgi:hypothetical protein